MPTYAEEAKRVAPYVGAWIETYDTFDEENDNNSRTLCGCVD